MKTEALYQVFKKYPKISTDTRNIQRNSIFFALKGASFNGNTFAKEALEKGAAFAVIDEPVSPEDKRFIRVDDALKTLQELAHYHRLKFSIPVIGITGSNGKTTTKELINQVLAQGYQTLATKGNLNNHIGVPLTLLEINNQTEIAIIEMGANHVGEIRDLCHIAAPTHGLITNIGKAHLEGFGSIDGVIQAKGELYDWIQASKGMLFLQADNPILSEMAKQRGILQYLSYGKAPSNQVSGEAIKTNPYLSMYWTFNGQRHEVDTQITGSYNAENVLAAICVGIHFKLQASLINKGISTYHPTNNRSQIIQTKRNTLICDYYNANASSMVAAIDNFRAQEGLHKILILGDMFELGQAAEEAHLEIIHKALHTPAESYIFIGPHFYKQKSLQKPGVHFYETTSEAKKALQDKPLQHAFILLKASRGMAFESLLEVF